MPKYNYRGGDREPPTIPPAFSTETPPRLPGSREVRWDKLSGASGALLIPAILVASVLIFAVALKLLPLTLNPSEVEQTIAVPTGTGSAVPKGDEQASPPNVGTEEHSVPAHALASEPQSASAEAVPDAVTAKSTAASATSQGEAIVASSPQKIISHAERSVVAIRALSSKGSASGSGFAIDANGTIATNYHVIEGAKSVRVVLPSGNELVASGWIAISPKEDIALLFCKLDDVSLPALPLRLTPPSKAETVYAIGNPMGLGSSVSSGIVSGIRRGLEIDADLDPNSRWIQTTAAMSPGNSGGPLLNADGKALGMSSMGVANAQGLNFAISAEHIQRLLDVSHELQQWSQLPPCREGAKADVAEVAMPVKSDRTVKEAVKMLADGARKVQEDRTASEEKQRELDRILKRIENIKSRQALIDAQGTAMNTRIAQINADGRGLTIEGQQVEQQIAAELSRASDYNVELKWARQNDRQDIVSNHQNQLLMIRSRVAQLRRDHAAMTARYSALDIEAGSLRQQFEAKRQQYDALEVERQTLEAGLEKNRP